MGWQDIYKKKMQAAGLENDIRSTENVQVFHREEQAQYGDWRDSFVKRMEESGMSGDIRLGQTQTAARQTVTAPTAPAVTKKRERQVVSPGGTALGGFSFAGKRQKTAKELADEKAQQELSEQEYQRLLGLELDKYRAEVEQAGKQAQKEKAPYNIHAFGGYDANRKTEAERQYAAMKADLNKAESLQYDVKGREALDKLTAEQDAALEVLNTERKDTAKRQAAWQTMQQGGYSDEEISQLAGYHRNIPKREKNAERYAKVQEAARNEGEKSPVGGTLLSVPANLLSGLGTVDAALRKLADPDTPTDYNAPAMLPYAYASGVRGEVTKNLQYDHGDGVAFLYGVGTSMLDSAATVALAALGVPPAAASATLGGAAATDAMVAAKERGLDDGHAIVTGVAAGVMESFFEKVSLESLISMKLPTGTMKQRLAGMLKNTAIQAGIEGSEEMFTDMGNLLADKIINGGMSDVDQRINAYVAGGMSYAEAQDKVAGEVVRDIAVDFGAGALAGGLMGGGNMAVQTAVQHSNELTAERYRQFLQEAGVQLDDQQSAEDTALTEASDKYGAQAEVFRSTYAEGQDVALYDSAYRIAYEYGKAGAKEDAVMQQDSLSYLSESQRKIAYIAGREAAAWQNGLGENGSKAWAEVQNADVESKDKLQAGFTVLYQAGLRRESAANVKSAAASALPQSVQTAAYQAGLSDAAASLAREKAGLTLVSSAGSESGLVDNEHSRKMVKEQAGTAALLNTLGKNLGVRIEMVDTISGGKANGVYLSGRNLIQIAADADNAFGFVAAHEVTHRMQELAPEEYRAYRDHAMSYRARESGDEGAAAYVERYRAMAEEAGVKLTQEEAMDEIAADFTRNMMESGKLFEDFAKENRSAAKKLLDALKAFIAKVKSLFRSKAAQDRAAQDAYGKSMAELEQCVALWQKAYDAAGKQAQRAKTAAREGDGGGRYQIKYPKYAESDITENSVALQNMDTIGHFTGNELGDRSIPLDKRVRAFFASLGNNVYSEQFGDVALSKSSINSEFRHGITPLKVVTFAAVPSVIKRGVVIYTLNKNSSGLERIVVAAPVTVGTPAEKMYVAVMLQRDPQSQRLYLHDAVTEKELDINSTEHLKTHRGPDTAENELYTTDILRNALNVKGKFSLKGMDSAYMAAAMRGDTKTAQEMLDEAAKAAGYTIKAYHGTARADRVGTVFLPERATSGPMAFFTDNRDIAANYARDKADTSLAYDEEYDDYYTQFRVKRGGKSLSVGELWNKLSPTERAKIKNAAPHIRFDEDYDQIIYDPSAQHGNGAYDAYELNRNKGNVLNTLVSTWLETGDLYDREADFLDVLKMVGVTDAEYRNPDARQEKVYETYLKIRHPFDTGEVGQSFYDGLSAWLADTDISAYQKESAGADTWDKNDVEPELFLERIAGDIEAGTSHAWTSIPDYVTAYLKELGYDGIKDTGGKGGGESHTVWIPFSSEQVKSAEPVTYDNAGNVIPLSERFNAENPDIRFQLKSATELEREVRELTKYAAYRQRGTTDREILLSAADGSAKTEWERKRLAEYRDAVGRLEGYEARLSANRAELTGLSLADGKKNAKRISYLEDEITKDTNRVAIVENKLKDLEGNRSLQELLGRERAMLQQQERTYLGKVEELLGGYRGLYGTMRKGEKAARDIQLPKKSGEDEKISQTVRTVLEAKATPEEMVPDIETLALEGKYSYEVYSDKAAIADADGEIRRVGWAQALTDWKSAMKAGNVSKKNTAMGWALYNNAANSGDTETALDVLSDMVQHQRSAAQALQATRILKQLSPETQLYQAQRIIANLQTQLNEEYGDDKAPKLKIDQTLAEQFMKAADQAERDAVLANIFRDIGKQMPSRFKDKWNAWRYLAMLGNVRTHVRNVVGNAGFVPVVAAKNAVATGIEKAVYRLSGGKMQRSKEFVTGRGGKALLEAAAQDYAKVADVAMGDGKYSDFANANKYIDEGRVIFRTKPLEAARKANSRALDREDSWFSKPHYAYAMAQYCKANGITAEMIAKGGDKVVKAREYAIKEAQKATYRDTNAFSQAISELGRMGRNSKNGAKRTISTVMEGILPFRKTPANILARGVEYSPIGLLNGFKQAIFDVQKGTKTAAEAIDAISAGLTGTGLLALGLFWAAQGVVRGHGDDDDKENDFMELAGHQAYALELPNGTSVTLDWLAPECLPFFVGVNLWELTDGGDKPATMADWLTAISQVSEPMLEMSCLQSLNDVFDSVGYASSNGLPGLPTALVNAAASYVSQGIPTILGQAERTGEGLRYTTFTSKNSKLTNDVQYALGRASAKIPIWDYSQIPYIDAWGRTESTGEVGTRAFNNFLNPAYTSTVDMSAMEEELLRLYEETGDGGILPSSAGKSITADHEKLDLTGEQYVKYAENRGSEAYRLMTALTQSSAYRSMSDEEKKHAVKDIYDYANQIAKTTVSSFKPDTWVSEAKASGGVLDKVVERAVYQGYSSASVAKYKEYGGSVSEDTFFTTWKAVHNMTGEDYDGDGKSDAYSKIDKQLEYINGLNLTSEEKRRLAIANGIKESTVDKRAPWR